MNNNQQEEIKDRILFDFELLDLSYNEYHEEEIEKKDPYKYSIVEFELSLNESEVWFYKNRNFHERTIILKEDKFGNLKNVSF